MEAVGTFWMWVMGERFSFIANDFLICVCVIETTKSQGFVDFGSARNVSNVIESQRCGSDCQAVVNIFVFINS